MEQNFKDYLIENEPHIATAIDYSLIDKLTGTTDSDSPADNYVRRLNSDGFVVIENFLNQDECDEICKEMDGIFEKHSDLVQVRGDFRLFGIECLSKKIMTFKTHPLLKQIASQYYQADSSAMFSLGGKLEFSEGETKSSGGGWHRDRFFRQVKAMLYLTDVMEKNGPFQLIKHSEKPEYILKDIQTAGLKYNQNRLEEKQVKKIIDANRERLITFIKPKGTLILFDSTTIHRGSPINDGMRYSLTNYYLKDSEINEKMLKHFSPNVYYNQGFTEYWNSSIKNKALLKGLFENEQYKDVVKNDWSSGGTIEQCFYKGKSFKKIGDIPSAIECFKLYLLELDNLSNIDKYSEVMTTNHISSVYFHLGECYLINKDYKNARKNFAMCLKYSNFRNQRCKELMNELPN